MAGSGQAAAGAVKPVAIDGNVAATAFRTTGEDDVPGLTPLASLPAEAAAEIGRVDASYRAALAIRPIEEWRFDTVRAGYQAIVKRWGDQPAVSDALRVRLADVTRHEQAAAAAREIRDILVRSRRRDHNVAEVKRRLADLDHVQTRTYHGVGYIRPSSRELDGRKLFTLVAPDGQTTAYLDLPPGVDVESLERRRFGVRGSVHFNQELGTRLITVRDVEPVGTRK